MNPTPDSDEQATEYVRTHYASDFTTTVARRADSDQDAAAELRTLLHPSGRIAGGIYSRTEPEGVAVGSIGQVFAEEAPIVSWLEIARRLRGGAVQTSLWNA